MILYDSKSNVVELEPQPFASGGEGDVYHIKSSNVYKKCCVKIFKPGKIDSRFDKLEYMIKHPLNLPDNPHYRICWPLDFVYQDGKPVGFIMPLAFEKSNSFYSLLNKDTSSIYDRTKAMGVVNRMKLLYNVVYALSNLHRYGYVMVDFKPVNLLFTDIGQISFLDIDSIQISEDDRMIFSPTAVTAEYAYPKEIANIANRKPCSQFWDVYGFAIVAYQIILGIHPFVAWTSMKTPGGNEITDRVDLMKYNLYPHGKNSRYIEKIPEPHYYVYLLPESLRNLFARTFDLEDNTVNISEWLTVLMDCINSGKIKENPFTKRPIPPVFILKNTLPSHAMCGENITLNWHSVKNTRLTINGKSIDPGKGSFTVELPKGLKITVVHGDDKVTYRQEYTFHQAACFCINCGVEYQDPSDVFCYNCGVRR